MQTVISRSTMLPLAAAAALVLAACGGDDDDDATDPATTQVAPETTADAAPVETIGSDDAGPCSALMTTEEFEALIGRSVVLNGSASTCSAIFADDAVGTMSAVSGAQGDELLSTFLERFDTDEYYSTNGIQLDDGRGYILDGNVAVRGESGQLFQVSIPDNAGIDDLPTAMQGIADLLLTR